MRLETFFEKFELFADAPNAIDKVRELILQLAVQGKLVSQDPKDEPATIQFELDEELGAQPAHLLSQGWTRTQLSKLADINGGFAFKSSDYTEEGARVVRISDFDEFGFKDHKVVRHPFTSELSRFRLAEGNILWQ